MTASLKNQALKNQANSLTENSLPLPHELLDALPSALLVVKGDSVIYANKTADELGIKRLEKDIIAKWCASEKKISIYDHNLRIGSQHILANIHIQPLENSLVMLVIHPHSTVAQLQNTSIWKEEITRSAGVMAAMLAHEVKNPLSSIRGAAQLLKESVPENERALIDLITSETLRIRDLLDQVEVFSNQRQVELLPLNIHEIIQYVIQVARAGFASKMEFVERYDPSLPLVLSHRDYLVQIMLNIVKNAAEALENVANPFVIISTSYQSGLRVTERKLPIIVNISDNGSGISAEIRKKLFEPLVSSKAKGRGLGLSVVAKIATDIGAVVECDENRQSGAGFTIYLPCV